MRGLLYEPFSQMLRRLSLWSVGARAVTGIITEASFGGQGRRRRLRHGAAG